MISALVGGRALVGEDLTPVAEAMIVVEDQRIVAAGPRAEVRVPAGSEVLDLAGHTLLPGFIDAHVHIGFDDPREVLAGGVTTVRDLGWPPDVIFELVRRSAGDSEMPRVLAAGPMLTAPGGYPTHAAWAPSGTGLEIASPDEGRRAVDELVERGAAVIKVALHPDVGPTFEPETLKAIVARAHERGVKVTGHISQLGELEKALGAGVNELAHMLMSPERIPAGTLTRMIAAGVVVVPTLSIRTGADLDIAIENLAAFLEAGGRAIYGTDLGNEGPRPGIDPKEVAAMHAAGMDARAIVASATVDAARHLGLDDVGSIAPGMEADLVAVHGDPLTDFSALTDVAMVWRSGSRIR